MTSTPLYGGADWDAHRAAFNQITDAEEAYMRGGLPPHDALSMTGKALEQSNASRKRFDLQSAALVKASEFMREHTAAGPSIP